MDSATDSWERSVFLRSLCAVPATEKQHRRSGPDRARDSVALLPTERVHDLLGGPLGGVMFRHIEVDGATPLVSHDDENKEYFVSHRRHDKEIQGDQIVHMVVEEGLPGR